MLQQEKELEQELLLIKNCIWRIGNSWRIGHMTIDYRGELCECGNRGCLEKYCSLLSCTEVD